MSIRSVAILFSTFMVAGMIGCQPKSEKATSTHSAIAKELTISATQTYQTIDGFGVNITPAQWRNGNLRPVIDSLVDDLGSTLIRFDCYGRADWLDPERQNDDGTFPEEYLKEVYTSPVFKDAWEAFRYFNSQGIEPIFNISGSINAAWADEYKDKQQRLKNFDSYAEMAVTLLTWARKKEGLKFSLFMPFNETDLGFPEGPRFLDEDCYPAFVAIMDKLKKNGFEDLPVIVLDDSHLIPGRLKAIVDDERFVSRVKGFGWHTYGNATDADAPSSWNESKGPYRIFTEETQATSYKDKSYWLTEYGDLDQSNEIEFEVAWRSARRLIKALNDGMTGAMVWDAFDNYHVHDSAWAQYGLFKTDTVQWSYKTKPRYYANKQFYKFIKPEFQRCEIEQQISNHIFGVWTDPLRNMYLSAYTSKGKDAFTFVGMSLVEADVAMTITLRGFSGAINGKKVYYYRTSRNENCVKAGEATVEDNKVTIVIPERSIVTITTEGN